METTMTTKTIRTVKDVVKPPRDIRDNTKARRAWLAAEAAKYAGQPGIETAVIGAGPYQELRVIAVTELPARIQYRGVCQVCCALVAVEGGATSLHGYQRPGYGFVVGRCGGAQRPPANRDLTLTRECEGRAAEDQERFTREAKRVKAEADAIHVGDLWQTDRPKALEMDKQRRELESQASRFRGQASGAGDYLTALRTIAIPAFGKALQERLILVADGSQ